MNLLERARSAAGNILNVKIEPVDEAFKRFDRELEIAKSAVADAEFGIPLVERLEGLEGVTDAREWAAQNARKLHEMRQMVWQHKRPRRVEVVIFGRRLNFERVQEFPLAEF